jgi:hypothetical protein
MRRSKPVTPTSAVSSLAQTIDQDEQGQRALFKAFLVTAQHFFGGFTALFQDVTDPRVPYLITYPLAALGFAGVLMFVCHLGARRQITHLLRGNGSSAAKFVSAPNQWDAYGPIGTASGSTWRFCQYKSQPPFSSRVRKAARASLVPSLQCIP